MNSSSTYQGSINLTDSEAFETLYLELLKWYFDKGNIAKAEAVAQRIDSFLAAAPEYADSIRAEEVRSIIAELRGDIPTAIQYREAEIRKIFELHSMTLNTPHWDYIADRYGFDDVSDRLDLLALLYDKQGELQRAIGILHESKLYCAAHKIPFDGQDVLEELEGLTVVKPVPKSRSPRNRAKANLPKRSQPAM